mgnify:FL=1
MSTPLHQKPSNDLVKGNYSTTNKIYFPKINYFKNRFRMNLIEKSNMNNKNLIIQQQQQQQLNM